MSKFNISLDYKDEIEAQDEIDARVEFFDKIVYDVQSDPATFIDDILRIEEIEEEKMADVLKVFNVKSIKYETAKAWLAIMEDDKEIWFPKSQCQIGENNRISVPEWLAGKKGLKESWDN